MNSGELGNSIENPSHGGVASRRRKSFSSRPGRTMKVAKRRSIEKHTYLLDSPNSKKDMSYLN
jgi:hypothetical protein